MGELEKKFFSLLQMAMQNGVSDIHLNAGQAPALRTHGNLVPVGTAPFTQEEMFSLCQFMMNDPNLKSHPEKCQDFDGSFEVKGLGRFRFNIYRTVSGICAVLRVITSKIPTIDDLKLPPVLKKIAEASRGMILVTGATGSGKSSTLAAMIDHLNSSQQLHIVTVEDPIEFLHPQRQCRISQREVGRDTKDFTVALKSALRQDPDVILLGEMRDIETLNIALKAAETGHLVFSTVHTSDAMKTVGRLISLFPPEEQSSARLRLADNLHAIISQRLIPGKHSPRVVAQEILINNLGISDCIANEKKTSEIPGFIEKGKEVSGMQTFDQHLAELAQKDLISVDVALEYATNPSDFQRNLSFGSVSIEDNNSSLQTKLEESLKVDQSHNESPALENVENVAKPTTAPPPPLAGAKPALAPLPPKPMAPPAKGTSTKIPKPPGAA